VKPAFLSSINLHNAGFQNINSKLIRATMCNECSMDAIKSHILTNCFTLFEKHLQ
jgi:hypothetical protein